MKRLALAAVLLAGCAQAHGWQDGGLPYGRQPPVVVTPPWLPHPGTGGYPGALPGNRREPPVVAVPMPTPPPGVPIPSNCVRASIGEMRCLVPAY